MVVVEQIASPSAISRSEVGAGLVIRLIPFDALHCVFGRTFGQRPANGHIVRGRSVKTVPSIHLSILFSL